MTGLYGMAVIGLLIWLEYKVAKWVSRRFVNYKYQRYATVGIFLILFPLPVADEIIGGFQFRKLCKEGAELKIDAEAIRGKTVELIISPPMASEYVKGTAVPIRHSHFSLVDAKTGRKHALDHIYSPEGVETGIEYAQYDTYDAEAGWFGPTVRITEKYFPMVIQPSSCGPENRGLLDKQYDFTYVKDERLNQFKRTLR